MIMMKKSFHAKRRWSCRSTWSRYGSGCSGSARESYHGPFVALELSNQRLYLAQLELLSQGSTVGSGQLAGWAGICPTSQLPMPPGPSLLLTSRLDPGLGTTVEG